MVTPRAPRRPPGRACRFAATIAARVRRCRAAEAQVVGVEVRDVNPGIGQRRVGLPADGRLAHGIGSVEPQHPRAGRVVGRGFSHNGASQARRLTSGRKTAGRSSIDLVMGASPTTGTACGTMRVMPQPRSKKPDPVPLSAAWQRALQHVQTMASGEPLDRFLRVTLHFHPDRANHAGGRPLLAGWLRWGLPIPVRDGTSNGGLAARPAGRRPVAVGVEMYGGAYDAAPVDQRPKYGSLNHRRRAVGGSVRFGSAHLRLSTSVLERTTFCYPDSHLEPTAFGTSTRMPLVALTDAASSGQEPSTCWTTTSRRTCTARFG